MCSISVKDLSFFSVYAIADWTAFVIHRNIHQRCAKRHQRFIFRVLLLNFMEEVVDPGTYIFFEHAWAFVRQIWNLWVVSWLLLFGDLTRIKFDCCQRRRSCLHSHSGPSRTWFDGLASLTAFMSVSATDGFLDCVCAGPFSVFALVAGFVGGFGFFSSLVDAARVSCAEAC